MHASQHAKYLPLTLVEVLCNNIKIRQGEDKSLLDYLSGFESKIGVIIRLFRKELADGFCKNNQAYWDLLTTDIAGQKALKEKEW